MSLLSHVKFATLPMLILGSVASAATTSFSTSISATANANLSPTESFSATFPQFDPSLGTLTGATITFSIPNLSAFVTVQSGYYAVFGSPSVFMPSQPYSQTVSGDVTVVNPNASDITTNPPFAFGLPPVVTIPFLSTPYSGTSPSDTSVATIGIVSVPEVDYSYATNAAQFAQITGTGSFSVPFVVKTDYVGQISDGTPIVGVSLSSFTGSETITYSFTPNAVPEPASLSLLGAGAFLLLRRRK